MRLSEIAALIETHAAPYELQAIRYDAPGVYASIGTTASDGSLARIAVAVSDLELSQALHPDLIVKMRALDAKEQLTRHLMPA